MHVLRIRCPGPRGGGWRAAATAALVVMTTIAAGTSVAAAAPLSRPDSAGNRPVAGTVTAKGDSGRRAVVQHAAAVPAAATGALSTVISETVHGGYTAAGIGMRNLGHGTISITGVPSGATVKSATLLWDVLADAADPSFAQGTINGNPVTGGTQRASGPSPCWPQAASNFSYEADVTSLVTGNGSYALAGFATGQSDGADPWNVGSAAPLLEGASLVVVYQLASMPQAAIQIAEGASETDSGNEADATMNGFTASAPASATTTYIVADGQYAGNTAAFNGSTLPDVSFPGADPQAVPNYSLGNLWDTATTDVSSLVNPGDTSATLTVTGNADCLIWVGQVLDVSASNGPVLGIGDSVAAGYGLGPSEGFPDNPAAYSAILAHRLGVQAQNYAVEGACASNAEAGCLHKSVNWQIGQVPDTFTPGLVTLTVGANDIDFGDCIKAILADSDLAMTSPRDPCNPTSLAANLSAFKNSLAMDLQTLSSKYPNASIHVMDYYNPFPQPPSAHDSACVLSKAVALMSEHAGGTSWRDVLKNFLIHHDKFLEKARSAQAQLYNDAQAVIRKLNATINATAAGRATIIKTDFTGHDICARGTEWAFSPSLAVDLAVRLGPLHKSANLSLGGDDVCPDPVAKDDWNFRKSANFDNKKLHFSGNLSIAMGVNCLPHPTPKGQTAIADNFFRQD